MKLNADKTLVDMNGDKIKMSPSDDSHFTFGKAISNILLANQTKKFDQLKTLELARKFYNGGEIDIDKSDLQSIKEIVTEDKFYNNILVLGQVQEFLLNAE